MDNYSQEHLKVAATEPEHVVRKAEFDLVVTAFDERIVAVEKAVEERPTGPVVLQTKTLVESLDAIDSVESPIPPHVSEAISTNDDVETRSPDIAVSNVTAETVHARDSVDSPQSIPLGEAFMAVDNVNGVIPAILLQNYEMESIVAADSVESPPPQGKPIMQETTNMQGEIEVVVEDRQGNVKSRQKVTNAITDAFLRYAFYDMMNGGSLSSVLRSNTRTGYNLLSRTVPSALGIYAMDRNIDIREDTFLPPYVCGDLNTLDPGVTFYNIAGNSTEDSLIMIPMDQRCYFDHNRREVVVEYIKNTGSGVVKSVCVGRSHLLKKEMYSVSQVENAVPNQWTSAAAAYYFIEHHPTNGSSLWKQASTATQYRFNFKTRTADTFTGATIYNNMVSATATGGFVVGDHVFKAQKQAATGANHTIRLYYVANFRTASASAYKDIVVTAREGMTAATDTMPVMIYRTDTGKLEIFIAVSCGDIGGTFGCNVHKVTVSGLENPATMTTETVDMGIVPYCISNFGTTYAYYLTGYFYGTNYYLPYTQTIDPTGKADIIAENGFQNGIVVSPDLKTVSRVFNMRSSTSGPNLVVHADTGLLQCQLVDIKIPYIFMSQVVSGANLPEPSVKGLDDVLRVIYRYRIA